MGAYLGASWGVVIIVNSLVIVFSFIDLLFSPKKGQLHASRKIAAELERGLPYPVHLELKNDSEYPTHFRIVDDLPQSFGRPFPKRGTVAKQTTTDINYETVAPVRGRYDIKKIYVRYTSLLGLWEKQTTITAEDTVKVIPDLSDTKHFLENAQQFLLYEGVKIRKQQSGAGEFAKIRSYVVGDDPRKINWRQTAKLQSVMTNEYEPEHGKYITILIDCGRMMGAELETGNRLERALESAITVAAAALKNGDYVSVLGFSKDVKVFVPAAKGMAHLQTILHSIYELDVDPVESNYAAVLHYVQTMQKKRSLLLLFSDVRSFLHEESALLYVRRLRQRHVFFMIGVEDKELVVQTKRKPTGVQAAMTKTIAQQQLVIKKREKAKWEAQGLQMVEVPEEHLAAAAVSYYINMLNRGLL